MFDSGTIYTMSIPITTPNPTVTLLIHNIRHKPNNVDSHRKKLEKCRVLYTVAIIYLVLFHVWTSKLKVVPHDLCTFSESAIEDSLHEDIALTHRVSH